MTGVSNMADQGRIILQFYSVCNLSIKIFAKAAKNGVKKLSFIDWYFL